MNYTKAIASFLLACSLPIMGLAQTVVNYDDGSTLTLKEGEYVYVTAEKLYTVEEYARGDIIFTLEDPTSQRDYVEPPTPIVSSYKGDHEWCLAYTPTGIITWDEVIFQRSCDTNSDGKYGCGDVQFDNSDDADVCSP